MSEAADNGFLLMCCRLYKFDPPLGCVAKTFNLLVQTVFHWNQIGR